MSAAPSLAAAPRPHRPVVLLRCPSGIAGNMWLAAALGLGADPEPLLRLPRTLRLSPARLALDRRWTGSCWSLDLEVVEVDGDIDGTYDDLRSRIRGSELPPDLQDLALQILARRRRADAGTPFARQRWWGGELTDTLVDVVGGVLAWDLLGRPVLTTEGPLAVGTVGGAVRSLLEGVPTAAGGCPEQLTTATGAALLHSWWRAHRPRTPAVARCEVRSRFARAFALPPMVATLHPTPEPLG